MNETVKTGVDRFKVGGRIGIATGRNMEESEVAIGSGAGPARGSGTTGAL